jgi:hypothetical protein
MGSTSTTTATEGSGATTTATEGSGATTTTSRGSGAVTAASASVPGPTTVPGGARMRIPPGLVGVPVRLADPTALTLIQPGDRVDLLRIRDDGRTEPVAQAALAIGITGAGDPLAGGLLLALDPATAKKAVASPERGYAVLLRPD